MLRRSGEVPLVTFKLYYYSSMNRYRRTTRHTKTNLSGSFCGKYHFLQWD
jgi:hypothetical protein